MTREHMIRFFGIALGAAVAGLGLVLFLIPNKIAAGGVSGMATVIYHLTGFPTGLTMLALNVPLFLLAAREMGIYFVLRTFYGTLAYSMAVDLLSLVVKPFTSDPLLSAVYGGVLVGVGLAIVIRSEGSTGGTDLASRLLHRYTQLTIGQALMIIDTAVIAVAGVVFNLELALYGLLSLFITTKIIDGIQEGFSYAKAALIISEHSDVIAQRIIKELDRGATGLAGRGLFTGQSRETILCVVHRGEISKLKRLVAETDPRAFVVLTDVREVLGEGFKEHRL
ncbi:MAG TPA: YitT family protein [Clostridia bacterium]|nr:YitT family protein [Clostridia bacterium]